MTEPKAIRQEHNVWNVKYFAIAMVAIMVLFMVRHWSGVIYFRYEPKDKSGILSRCVLKNSKAVRRYLCGKAFGLPVNKLLLYMVYWIINLILLLTNVKLNAEYIARRFGWISTANLVLLVFLSLKNTPLAPLTAQSYEKLRPLHKTAGYTCITTSVLHGVIFLIVSSMEGMLHYMRERRDFAGAIAGLAMVIIGLSTIPWIMGKQYEMFYLIHITLFILILITVGMHRPDFSTSTLSIVIFTACIWICDRILRAGKICWNFWGNYATITPLPNNAVLVRLSWPLNSRPGSHAFLWIPAIRWIETHPFTMTSTNPVQLVIRVYDGFTRDLYKAAQSIPGRSLRCSIDGGYGQIPNFGIFGRVILVAGGSGASFTFAIALDLIEKSGHKKTTKAVDFIWAVQYGDTLDWFEDELRILETSPVVNLVIHVTRGSNPPPALVQNSCGSDLEKGSSKNPKEGSLFERIEIREGRPNIVDLIDTAAASSDLDDRIIVGACGPGEMVDQTRKAVFEHVRGDSPSITLYTEEFG